MDFFSYKNGELHAEDVAVKDIAAIHGTPLYIYSRATIERHWHAFNDAFASHPHQISYAVKANSNLAVLDIMKRLGSGFDIVSAGEMQRVLKVGAAAKNIVFSGVGKNRQEIEFALRNGIGCLNVESDMELQLLSDVAQALAVQAPIALRVNPNVDANTHPNIATGLHSTKFGIDSEQALKLYAQAAQNSHLTIKGIACHIGSQITEIAPYLDALNHLLDIVDTLAGQNITLQHIDLGGGLGIRYRHETPPLPMDYARPIIKGLQQRHPHLKIEIEPGRAIVGNAGILVTRTEFLKTTAEKSFAIVDAGMNDLMRPALYQAWQEIISVDEHPAAIKKSYDVVGPVCETTCKFGSDRMLALEAGDLLAIRSTGAYGAVMSNNYNSRARPAEVMVDGTRFQCVRQRDSFAQMIAGESILA